MIICIILLKQLGLFQSYYKDSVFTALSLCLPFMTNVCFTTLFLFIVHIFHFLGVEMIDCCVMEIEFIFFRQKLFNLLALFKDEYLLSQKYSTLVASVFSCSPKKLDWKAIPSIWSNFWIHKG